MLVGGGELHERWSLARRRLDAAVGRGIQRFTGITQAMVDDAPPPEARAARARPAAARAACSSRTRRASTSACCAARSPARRWTGREPPVLCTVAMARRFAPLQRGRGLAALADALGIEVEVTPPRAAGRRDLRAGVLRAVRAG